MINTDTYPKKSLTGLTLIGLMIMTLLPQQVSSQVRVPFTHQPTSPAIYSIKGDFTMIGNTNMTLQSYSLDGQNGSSPMIFVDVDGDSNTLNSSSATLTFSNENGAIPLNSNIIYAGLYWTGRAHNGTSSNTFQVTKNGVTKNYDKSVVYLKHANAGLYSTISATDLNFTQDIYYPTGSDGYMYSAYANVTDYVKQYGLGQYTVADIALRETDGVNDNTGFYGGWGMVVVYENPLMNWRDVTIFDGHAYVGGNISASYDLPVSGFNTVQSGQINMKLGMMAGEGDRPITGDYFRILNQSNTYVSLSHSDNSIDNFFNSSINTGANARNPNLVNNTGIDIAMFDIPNAGNSIITNNQTSTTFRYGTTQDTYIIYCIAMAVDCTPQLSITKIAAEANFDAVGDIIHYTIVVTNTGTVALANVVITDALTGLNQTIASLSPGSANAVTINTTHTITQADLDLGRVGNIATATFTYGGESRVQIASQSIPAIQSPALTITKNATESGFSAIGNVIHYGIVVTNTGNVTLTNVVVTDPLTSLNQTIGSLLPGSANAVTINTAHTITQADLNAGKVDNTARASYSFGGINYSPAASKSVPATQSSSLTITKNATESSFSATGNVIHYTIVVTNTGNVNLTNVVVTDPLTSLNQTIPTLLPGSANAVTINTTHSIIQADLDAGKVDNTARAAYSFGGINYALTASRSVPAVQAAALTITKNATEASFNAPGNIIHYIIVVTNTGNVNLTNVVVTDPLTSLNQTIASLLPGSANAVTINTAHTITQADLNAGKVDNTARASCSFGGINYAPTASKSVPAAQSAALTITKNATETSFNAPGNAIHYTIVVTNTGNVNLTNVVLTDPLTSLNQTIGSLLPGSANAVTFTTTYTITQADLDAGKIINSASVTGLDPLNNPVTESASETITATQKFILTLTKSSDPEGSIAVKNVITYTINLKNSGNVNLINVQVTDLLPAHTTFVSADNGGVFDENTNAVKWLISRISPDEILSLQLKVNVDGNAENDELIHNTAQAENSQIGTVGSNTTEITVLRYLFLRLVSATPVSCYGRNNGSASVEVYGGTAPYTYTWDTDPVQTGPIATNLQAGTYNVRVEDALGHTDELPVTVAQPLGALSATTSVTNVLCRGESSGSIEINVTGGTAPYSFLWSNNATTRNINEVPAKQYTVNITDANGCSLIIGAKIEEPAESLRISNIEIKGVKCIDDPFGSIKYDLSGGVPSYTYLWNNSATTQYLDNIGGGDYTLAITDNVGCKLIQNFFVDYENTDCEVRVPSGLTPNSQFDNRLVIRGLENYPDNKIKIFNRYGSPVYEASPYQNDWDGSSNVHGNFTEADGKLPDGTYFYYLELGTSGNVKSGYVYLIKK